MAASAESGGALFTCPAEGCSYGPLPKSSVAGHYSGKGDDAHAGGWERAMLLLEEQEPAGQAGAKPAAESDGSSSRSSGRLEFPAAPDPVEGCPKCGHEDWYATNDLLEAGGPDGPKGPQWSDEERAALEQHERACADCGEVYDG